MKNITRGLGRALLAAVAMGVLTCALQAAVVAVTTRAGITETDFIDWAAVQTALGTNTPASGSSSVTNVGVTFTFSEADNNTMNLFPFGSLPGTDLGTHNVSGSAMTLSFAQPFSMIGFDLQSNQCCNGAYSVNFDVYNGNTLLQSFSGSTFSSPNANAMFVGASSDALNITRVVISTNQGSATQYAIDKVSLSNTTAAVATPEPGTFGLMLLGGVGVLAFARKRLT